MLNNRYLPVVIAICGLAVQYGCVGVDSTIFYTKTNRGLEVGNQPPVAAIDASRDEGVITPQFSNGATLPVLASFKTEDDGLYAGLIGSTFATGDAAATMASLYSSSANHPTATSAMELTAAPTKSDTDNTNPLAGHRMRAAVFSTKTSLGLNLHWSAVSAVVPEQFTFGYNRKEVAVLPVSYQVKDNKHYVDQTSFLATLGFAYDQLNLVPGGQQTDQPKLLYLQYFATGVAATKLAAQPQVRINMLNKLDPSANLMLSEYAVKVLPTFVMLAKNMAKQDVYAAALLAKVQQKAFAILPDSAINLYQQGSKVEIRMLAKQPTSAITTFEPVYAYLSRLKDQLLLARQNLDNMKTAQAEKQTMTLSEQNVTDGTWVDAWSRPPTETDIAALEQNNILLQHEFITVYQSIAADNDIKQLFRYVSSQVAAEGI